MLKKLLLSVLLCLPFLGYAQSYMTGNVFDNEQRNLALQGVSVRNLSTKAVVVTDKDGHYAIPAKNGDLIVYALMGYQTDTVYLVNLFPKNSYLRAAVNTLNPVNVTTTKVSPFLDTKDPEARPTKQVDYSKNRGGLRLNLGYGKYRRQQAKEQELEEAADINEEISKNFNREVIQKLVNYKGKDLDDYIGLYRPTVSQVKADKDFDYTYYIATTFTEWRKLPENERKLPVLPKLKAKP
jgi:hypothetical protein